MLAARKESQASYDLTYSANTNIFLQKNVYCLHTHNLTLPKMIFALNVFVFVSLSKCHPKIAAFCVTFADAAVQNVFGGAITRVS